MKGVNDFIFLGEGTSRRAIILAVDLMWLLLMCFLLCADVIT